MDNTGYIVCVFFCFFLGFSTQTTKFSGLEAYWNYTFSVVAATDKGNSDQSEKSDTVTTLQDGMKNCTLKLTIYFTISIFNIYLLEKQS